MKILLVDDDFDLLDVTSYALRREGFQVVSATDGNEAIRRWQAEQPDLVVLDIGLPRLDGFEVCRKIRESAATPIIMLTALSDEERMVQAFELGADDYMVKPFSPRLLATRIRAVARRAGAGELPVAARELRLGDLTLEIDTHSVRGREGALRLTPIEFRIFYLLANNAGRVVTTERLVEYAWGYDGGESSLLKTHISNIRKKLRMPPDGHGAIRALPTLGYQFVWRPSDLASANLFSPKSPELAAVS